MLNLPIKILQTIQLETAQATVTFDDIANQVAAWDARENVTSRHLVLVINARSIDASDYITNFLRFNGDVGNNYNYQRLSGINAAVSAGRTEGANAINLPPIQGANIANAMGGSMVIIPHAFNTTNHKVVLALGGASENVVEAVCGRWASAAAITSVTILEGVNDDFVAGSTFQLGVVDERYLVEEVNLAAPDYPSFDNIPQGEGDLVAIGYARSTSVDDGTNLWMYLNDDETVTNYWCQILEGANAVVGAATSNNSLVCRLPGDNSTAGEMGVFIVSISQYTKGNIPHWLSVQGRHGSVAPTGLARVTAGRWIRTEPINKVEFQQAAAANLAASSLFSLYRVPKRIIERQELTADAATITFANIPQNFEALVLHAYLRSDRAALDDTMTMEFNGDGVAANYDRQYIYGWAAATGANRLAADAGVGIITGNTAPAGEFGSLTVIIPGYNETDRHKHRVSLAGADDRQVNIESSRWENVAAITRIDLDPVNGANFLAGSVFELEGILRREGLPAIEGMSID